MHTWSSICLCWHANEMLRCRCRCMHACMVPSSMYACTPSASCCLPASVAIAGRTERSGRSEEQYCDYMQSGHSGLPAMPRARPTNAAASARARYHMHAAHLELAARGANGDGNGNAMATARVRSLQLTRQALRIHAWRHCAWINGSYAWRSWCGYLNGCCCMLN